MLEVCTGTETPRLHVPWCIVVWIPGWRHTPVVWSWSSPASLVRHQDTQRFTHAQQLYTAATAATTRLQRFQTSTEDILDNYCQWQTTAPRRIATADFICTYLLTHTLHSFTGHMTLRLTGPWPWNIAIKIKMMLFVKVTFSQLIMKQTANIIQITKSERNLRIFACSNGLLRTVFTDGRSLKS